MYVHGSVMSSWVPVRTSTLEMWGVVWVRVGLIDLGLLGCL